MGLNPPGQWADLPFELPSLDADPGTVLALPDGRLLVRSYDAFETATGLSTSDPNARYQLDISDLRIHEDGAAGLPRVGDTVMYLGEVRDDQEPNLWHPMRVVYVADAAHRKPDSPYSPAGDFLRVWCVQDLDLTPGQLDSDPCLPRHLLEDDWDTITDLAFSGRAATTAEAQALLAIFECDWVLDRKHGWN